MQIRKRVCEDEKKENVYRNKTKCVCLKLMSKINKKLFNK